MFEKWQLMLKHLFSDNVYEWLLVLSVIYIQAWILWIEYEVKDKTLHIRYPARFFRRNYSIPLNNIEEIAPLKPWARSVNIFYDNKKLVVDFRSFDRKEKFMAYLSRNGFELTPSDRSVK